MRRAALRGDEPPGLPPRTLEVLALAALGLSNPEIARYFGTSPETVHSQMAVACARLGRNRRLAAAYAALGEGLLQAAIPFGRMAELAERARTGWPIDFAELITPEGRQWPPVARS